MFELFYPEYALDFLLLGKITLKLDVNSVSLMQHTSSVCFTHETANFFGLLPLITNSTAKSGYSFLGGKTKNSSNYSLRFKGIRGEFGESIFLSTDILLFGTIFEKWKLKQTI